MTEAATSPGSHLERLVEGLDYPMFVVTTAQGDERAGCLVGFATQASLDPPRMLVCISVENHTERVAERASSLAVHVLNPDQHHLAELFGATTGDDLDKFARCAWRPGPGGEPLLSDAPRWMVGHILERRSFGDHVGYLLEPTASGGGGDTRALSFQQVRRLPPGHPA